MKTVLAFALSLLLTVAASAQNYVYQSGNVTPNHGVMWTTNGVISDAGTAAAGKYSSLGVTAQGPGICQNNAFLPTPYNQICLGVTSSGAQISVNGGVPLSFLINGTTYSFPFATGGGVVGPNTTVIGCSAPWANTTGTLLANSCITYAVTAFGAKCDGSTNDATALQAALNAIGTAGGGSLSFPSGAGCKTNSLLTYSSSAGPLLLIGAGPESGIAVGNATGGLEITGGCGATADKVYLKDLTFTNVSGGTSGYGLFLNGTAVYGLDNVNILPGANPFTYGIKGLGAQQGYIHGGFSTGNTTGIYLNDCAFGPGAASNGVDISGGRSFDDVTAAIDVEGGAGGVWMHDLHITSSATGIINNASGSGGGGEVNIIDSVHFELNATVGTSVSAGQVNYSNNGDTNTATIEVHSGAIARINNNIPINGTAIFDSGSSGTLINNLLNSSPTISASAGSVLQFGNAGSLPAIPSYFTSSAQFTSPAGSAGDILTLKPNASVSGAWGMSITGAGPNQDIYLSLGGLTWNGNTGGSTMTLKSAVSGTQWAQFAANTMSLGVQQTAQGGLILSNTAAGSYATTIKSSNSASAAWTFTLPTTAGTGGYALTTDGSGNGSWTNLAATYAPLASPTFTGTPSGPVYTLTPTVIASLPSCGSGNKGQIAFVSDTTASGAATFHGTVSGSGSTTVNSLASCNGSSWQYD